MCLEKSRYSWKLGSTCNCEWNTAEEIFFTLVPLNTKYEGIITWCDGFCLWKPSQISALPWSFRYCRRFTWSLHFPRPSTQVLYSLLWWKMSCVEWSAFSLLQTDFRVFWVFALTLKPLKCGSAASCFAEQKMLLWASCSECRTDTHTLLWDLHRAANKGWVAQLEHRRHGGACMEPSITPRAAEPLWQPRAPLMGKPPRMAVWPCRSFKGAAEAALTAQVLLLGRQVTHLAALLSQLCSR